MLSICIFMTSKAEKHCSFLLIDLCNLDLLCFQVNFSNDLSIKKILLGFCFGFTQLVHKFEENCHF